MPRLIVPILAILIAGSALVPGRLGPASAHQASPAASPAADCPATTPEENKALVRRYFEAHNERNPAAVAELLSDDFIRGYDEATGSWSDWLAIRPSDSGRALEQTPGC